MILNIFHSSNFLSYFIFLCCYALLIYIFVPYLIFTYIHALTWYCHLNIYKICVNFKFFICNETASYMQSFHCSRVYQWKYVIFLREIKYIYNMPILRFTTWCNCSNFAYLISQVLNHFIYFISTLSFSGNRPSDTVYWKQHFHWEVRSYKYHSSKL